MTVTEFQTEVLLRPETLDLRYLPEGPCIAGSDHISWVAIQHGREQTTGSLNLLDLRSRKNTSYPLPGRPGFAFPTHDPALFVVGLERRVGVFNISDNSWKSFSDELEQLVSGTIINDGVAFDAGIVFGAKDVTFTEAKAGLYFWRSCDNTFHQLRNDQTCSNGKIISGGNGRYTLFDIDTPTKTVVRYELETDPVRLSSPATVVIDLRSESDFPDGMIATPDGQSVIIAFYNPADVDYGQARQYSLATGQLEAVWNVPQSPRVTCPLLIELDGEVRLILTTADEGMTPDQQARHVNAGCLFLGRTSFSSAPEQPRAPLPR